MNLTVEHMLMFVLVFCAFYYLMKGGCGYKEGIMDLDETLATYNQAEGILREAALNDLLKDPESCKEEACYVAASLDDKLAIYKQAEGNLKVAALDALLKEVDFSNKNITDLMKCP